MQNIRKCVIQDFAQNLYASTQQVETGIELSNNLSIIVLFCFAEKSWTQQLTRKLSKSAIFFFHYYFLFEEAAFKKNYSLKKIYIIKK